MFEYILYACRHAWMHIYVARHIYVWQGVMLRYARWIGGLSHQSSNLSHLPNPLQKVVICALIDTRFKRIQVVNYLTNYQTTKVMLTKVFPKCLGAYTWINKVQSSSRIYSCSMRGTNIARVEGRWLNNGPNHSVPGTQTTAPRLKLTFLIYFPPPIGHFMTSQLSALIFLWENHCACAEEMP